MNIDKRMFLIAGSITAGLLLIIGAAGNRDVNNSAALLVFTDLMGLALLGFAVYLSNGKGETMREKDFETKVKAFLKSNDCWVLKTWSNGIQRQGVPDLLVCCNGCFLGVELKNETGKASELQKWNIGKIREAGGLAFVLYPEQFEDFKKLIKELNSYVNCKLVATNERYAYLQVKGANK